MARITVLGGTGYTGRNLVHAAAARGHEVYSVSRTADDPHLALDVREDATPAACVRPAGAEVDAIVVALSPRGEMAGRVAPALRAITTAVHAAGVRLIVIGGYGALRPAPGAPRIAEAPEFPAAYRPESLEMIRVLEDLQSFEPDLDWLMVSPTAGYGVSNQATGQWRWGGELVVPDATEISGADLASAVVEEIEQPARGGHASLMGAGT